MEETIKLLIEAIQAGNWYPVVALSFTLLIAALRLVSPEVWAQLPSWAKPIPAIVLNALAAFVLAFNTGEVWQQALGMGLWTIVVGTITTIGGAELALRTAKAFVKAPAPTSPAILVDDDLPEPPSPKDAA